MEKVKDKNEARGFKIIGDWKEHAKHLKTKYAQLTDDDLAFAPGKEDDLLRKVKSRLNKNREEVIEMLNKVQNSRVF